MDKKERFSRYYAARKAAGLCVHCRKQAAPGRVYCLECADKSKARSTQYRAEHPDQVKASMASWRARHPDDSKTRSAQWHDKHPEYRRTQEAHNYGCPREYVDQWNLACQLGRCDICNKLAGTNRNGRLHRDHSHTDPPVPRGCLCVACNNSIGHLEKVMAAKPFDISQIDNPFFAYLRARDPRYADR